MQTLADSIQLLLLILEALPTVEEERPKGKEKEKVAEKEEEKGSRKDEERAMEEKEPPAREELEGLQNEKVKESELLTLEGATSSPSTPPPFPRSTASGSTQQHGPRFKRKRAGGEFKPSGEGAMMVEDVIKERATDAILFEDALFVHTGYSI